jgi:ATP:ADP antiporter, AAA family
MYHGIIRALWGDLRGGELKKFLLLALAFFFLIGSFWPLKTLKDSIFVNIVGTQYQPLAKMLSLFLFFPLVLAYSKIVDLFAKEKIIYCLIGIYGFIGYIFVYYFLHPTIGLENTVASADRYIGWMFFLYVESYISLIISLYWSFVNDITTTESAKRGYGLIIFGTQAGGFLFTLLGNRLSADTMLYSSRAPLIIFISVTMFFLIALVTFILNSVVEKDDLRGYVQASEDKAKVNETSSVGFLDGLILLLTHPYVAGIFGTIFFYELISTVMNFQMLLIAKATYQDGGMVNKFLFDYALCVQGIACMFGLVGTSFFQRRFGIRFCIVAYPIIFGLSIIFYILNPSLSSIFVVMLIAKAINYAFNQPAKEVLYIPTSKNIKYKSKAWIDMFGLRFAKATGASINKMIGPVVSLTGGVVICCIGLWIVLANFLGNMFYKSVSEKKLIE